MDGAEPITRIANATNRGDEPTKSAGKCGQIYDGLNLKCWGPAAQSDDVDNHLMLNCYFINSVCSTDTWRRDFANRSMNRGRGLEKSHAFLPGRRKNAVRRDQLCCILKLTIKPDLPLPRRLSRRLNLTHCGDTKSSMRRDVSGMRTRFEWENSI
jgi:hypothetical protein